MPPLSNRTILIAVPHFQLSNLTAQAAEDSADVYPRPLEGQAVQGRAVYVSEGCVYCHSQQVRAEAFGTDIARGWGDRRTVPRDYLYDYPILLGTMRTGPDLSNIGARQPDDTWHLLHLYNPVITSPGSIMPPFDYLFEKRRIVGEKAYDALPLKDEWAPPAGFEIVPTERAKALVAYLKAQNRSFPLKEAAQ
jgi:cytochrome c oxidase cbb3-type subunit II